MICWTRHTAGQLAPQFVGQKRIICAPRRRSLCGNTHAGSPIGRFPVGRKTPQQVLISLAER